MMMDLLLLQITFILCYLILFFPQLIRFSPEKARLFRWVIISLMVINGFLGLSFVSRQKELTLQEIAISGTGVLIFLTLLFSTAFIFLEFWPKKIRKFKPLIILVLLIPGLFFIITSSSYNFPYTDYRLEPPEKPPGNIQTLDVIDYEIKRVVPYLYSSIYYKIDITFYHQEEKIQRKEWPVRLETVRGSEPLLEAIIIPENREGFLAGFYQPVLIIDTREYLVLMGDYPERFAYSREMQRNINTFMGW